LRFVITYRIVSHCIVQRSCRKSCSSWRFLYGFHTCRFPRITLISTVFCRANSSRFSL